MIYYILAWYTIGFLSAMYMWRKYDDVTIGIIPMIACFGIVGPIHLLIAWLDDSKILDKVILKKATKK